MDEPRIDTTPEAFHMVVAKKIAERDAAKQRDAYRQTVKAINDFQDVVFLPGMSPADVEVLNVVLRRDRFFLKEAGESTWTIQPVLRK